jgi:hypothetical protein
MNLDEANGAVLLEQSESQPSPIPSPSPSRVRMFFSGSQPEEESRQDLLPGSPLPDDAGSGSDSEWLSDPDESPSETSSPASSADGGGPLKPLSKAALKATSRKGVLIATSAVHRFAAKTELEKQARLYIADDQDQELIGDPVANLLSRRGGVVGGKMSEDANDALGALMGLANYIGKQVALTVEIGRIQAGGRADTEGEVA